MPKQRLREFDRQLRAVVEPKLSNYSFILGDHRTFRRVVTHEGTVSTQIIEFQVGVKSLSGKFTVNLGVFNPDYTSKSLPAPKIAPHSYDCQSDLVKRLGFLKTPRVMLVGRLFCRKPIARDHWWKQHANAQSMLCELSDVERVLFTDGLAWLEAHTSLSAFRWALNELDLRKQRVAASGPASPPAPFEPQPLPQSPRDKA